MLEHGRPKKNEESQRKKNNSGRDVMIDSPSLIHQQQLDELQIAVNLKK